MVCHSISLLFDLNWPYVIFPAGEITSKAVLDYEQLFPNVNYNLSITVTDGVASDTDYLEIEVLDVNEPPYFIDTIYNLEGNEGQVWMYMYW